MFGVADREVNELVVVVAQSAFGVMDCMYRIMITKILSR